jgi:hypothetical protein
MPNVYGQNTKITDVVGRSRYISGESDKQEEVIVHEKNMMYDWSFYSAYERENAHQENQRQNEAREMIIALPNELADKNKNQTSAEQKIILKEICDELVSQIVGEGHDHEYAVHWNHDRTNLHVHILYSERKVIQTEPKRYKKDIWQDKDTHQLAKANAENAELVHRKGDIMRDKEGNIRYTDTPLSAKDTRFKEHSFMSERNKCIQSVLKRFGYDLSIQDKETPYLSQKKLYKGASMDYLENARAYNSAVKDYNRNVKMDIEIQPEREGLYCEIRKDIEDEIKKANSRFKKISQEAIKAIKEMSDHILNSVKQAINTMGEYWNQNKDKILDLFQEKDTLQTKSDIGHQILEKENQRVDRLEDEVIQERHIENMFEHDGLSL